MARRPVAARGMTELPPDSELFLAPGVLLSEPDTQDLASWQAFKADRSGLARYICRMSVNSESMELKEARASYSARWEAVEVFKAHELAAMTEERARQIIQMLGAVEAWRERPDSSDLVEQQAIFHRGRRT